MSVILKISNYIRKNPYGAAEEFSIPAMLAVPLLMWNWSSNGTLLGILGLGAVAHLSKALANRCERNAGIDLESLGSEWEALHWMLWCARLIVSTCLSALFGLMVSIVLEQFLK